VSVAAATSRKVSVLLPTLNERPFIRDCLESLIHQQSCVIDEILVLDGGSTDGTRDIVDAVGAPARLVPNPGVTAAAAMNLGLAEARNDLVVRADAHTQYAPDYVAKSLAALERSGADWVGGPMVPVGANVFGRAVAAVTSSPFGVGPGRFHYATEAGDVETVYLGTFDRRIVFEVGGYDEVDLQWAAEDQELAFRLRRSGRRIHLDPTIRSWYVPRDTITALWRQYANYGMCKASTLRKHRTLPYWRPLVPAAMVAGAAAWTFVFGVRGRWVLAAAPVLVYTAGAGAVSMRIGDQPGVAPHRVLIALSVCHWGYGVGFWRGVGRILTGRPFDNRPKGGRR
jgi:glycosyltransferase involved in cell wall biosynthesis